MMNSNEFYFSVIDDYTNKQGFCFYFLRINANDIAEAMRSVKSIFVNSSPNIISKDEYIYSQKKASTDEFKIDSYQDVVNN